jgi:Dolichyl-phosphate-mannose-protein mannosyltransferase
VGPPHDIGRSRPGRTWAVLAALVSLGSLAFGLHWGTFVAGGSDSYCYVGGADLWARGALLAPQPIGFVPPWPNAALTLAPTGFFPSDTVPGAIAPICPPGLSLTMALFWKLAGPSAVFLVVPALGALAIWLTFLLTRDLDGPLSGFLAAMLVTTSPILLFQVLQPMSDVPAAAWWLAAVVLAAGSGNGRLVSAGLATSLAILTRPNLAPLALGLLVFVAARPRSPGTITGSLGRSAAFIAGVLPGVAALLWIQSALYGSPFRSGYGSPEQLFSLAHVWPNLQRYPRWLLETHTPLLGLSLAAPFVIRARARSAGAADGGSAFRLSAACLALAAFVFASYLVYVPFDEWWYIRFLLPAVPLLAALSVTTLGAVFSRLAPAWRAPASLSVVIAVVIFNIHTAADRGVLGFRESERRFADNGSYIAGRLPDRAVVLTTWESGSVRFYGHRLSIMWDSLDPGWLDRTISFLQRVGRPPYLLFEPAEEQQFRDRFTPANRYGALDWPPMAQLPFGVRLYDPLDRDRYLAGETVSTERVWPRGERAGRGR